MTIFVLQSSRSAWIFIFIFAERFLLQQQSEITCQSNHLESWDVSPIGFSLNQPSLSSFTHAKYPDLLSITHIKHRTAFVRKYRVYVIYNIYMKNSRLIALYRLWDDYKLGSDLATDTYTPSSNLPEHTRKPKPPTTSRWYVTSLHGDPRAIWSTIWSITQTHSKNHPLSEMIPGNYNFFF